MARDEPFFCILFRKVTLGWPKHGPYDRVIVTASVSRVPDELLEQLDAGGRMTIPVGG
ncbi:hypothetical protein [Lentibacillus sp. CBA3610]|uniref:hypothetical protein n=1 Tax=Lentibacillus sp. CBA3610 TaxID=2518176 RepID=UPI0015957BF7|nr:hypothetical protein Len3610_11750 [Lentibacillus sp. CBA3610]